MKSSKQHVQAVWFKRDLRIDDHEPLHHAAARGPVLPFYIIEPSVWSAPDFDRLHGAFILDSLRELRSALAALGQPLIVRIGEFPEVLADLHTLTPFDSLWSHQETGVELTFARDRRVRDWCNEHQITWHECRTFGVVRGRLNRDGWQRQWQAHMDRPIVAAPSQLHPVPQVPVGDMPTLSQLPCTNYHPATAARQQTQTGGLSEAAATLDSFLHQRGAKYHREMSSPNTAFASCSRLSPYLAWGCLSMRTAVQAVTQRQEDIRAMPSSERPFPLAALRAMKSRLHWHCHFIQKLESEPAIEFHCFNRACDSLRVSEHQPERFDAWITGRTGYPFVDACMRALQTWGWINFRMRAMLTSFAAYDCWLDWRVLNAPLARQFLDYEPGIHLSQLQMQSGVTGINTLRMYNPVKQGLDHDPEGTFIRRWVPELAHLSDDRIHQPWKTGDVPAGYPQPIVDHQEAIRFARAQFADLRRSPHFQREKARVYEQHGSRKRPTRRPKRKPRTTKPADAQQELAL